MNEFIVAPSCCIPAPIVQSVSTNSFTVMWDRESCLSHNGADRHYVARYNFAGSSDIIESRMVTISNRIFTATSLSPRTSYTFQVAFVNQVGSGPYTSLTINTFGLPCKLFKDD